ncbi:uncharacterized protein [Littorina saxatilis]|uniref:uncharacterized protein isoform X2 n=1 Tax=Littorina saxatilis TaxID=31220 RepID=UPI0038B54835
MVSIGDIKNNLRILQSEARQMKYQGEFELEGLVKGNPQSLLPLYNYLFTNYCSEFTVEVMNLLSDGLSMKADVRFMESVYKICRDMFGYKPPMTKEQFFTANSFAERKVIMCFEVMRLVKERCRYLGPRNPTNPNIKVQSVVDTGRHSKRTSECELVTSEPSENSLKNRKSSTALLGLSEKEGWQVKLGYLRPAAGPEGEEGRRSGRTSREEGRMSRESGRVSRESERVSRDGYAGRMLKEEAAIAQTLRELSPPEAHSRKSKAEVVDMPSGRRTAESGHTRISDMLAKSHDHSSDWDPSEAVECILSKVRDLPAQLTNFMKAVEGRLQKIEERLDLVEVKAVHVNYTEGSNAVPGKWKQDLDTVQSRLLLLENRVMLCENRSAPRTASSDHPKLVGDKTTELSAASPFVSLERGGDSFSGSMLHNFSPIRKGDGDVNQYSNNDTITSVADVEKRLSSTPNMSGNTLSLVPTGGGRQGREAAWRKGDAATGADGDGGDVTAPCENLDTSTLQQVERIKSLFKTTQRLLPTGSQSSRDS